MAGSQISSLGNIYTPRVSEAQFKSWMSSIEERVRTLETQQRLFNASVKGGAIVAYDDNVNQIARLGKGVYNTVSGNVTAGVLSVTNASSSEFILLIDEARGLVSPATPINFAKEDHFSIASGAGILSAWKSTIPIVSKVLLVSIVAFTDAGVTGRVWLELNEFGPITHNATFNNSTIQNTFRWDISSLGFGYNDIVTLRVWGEVTSGTGNMSIVTPDACRFGIIEDFPTADVNGDV